MCRGAAGEVSDHHCTSCAAAEKTSAITELKHDHVSWMDTSLQSDFLICNLKETYMYEPADKIPGIQKDIKWIAL